MKFMQLLGKIHENTIDFLVYIYKNKDNINAYIFFAIIITAVMYVLPINSTWLKTIAATIAIICVLACICIHLPKVLVSFKYFITAGISYSLGVSAIIYLCYTEKSQTVSLVWQYLIFSAINLVLWNLFSIMANCKVSTLANVVLTALLGINEAVFDLVMSMLPDTLITFTNIGESIKKNHIEIVFDIITTPLVITNITATVLCAVKLYWVEKYAGGLDLTQELLEQSDDNRHTLN